MREVGEQTQHNSTSPELLSAAREAARDRPCSARLCSLFCRIGPHLPLIYTCPVLSSRSCKDRLEREGATYIEDAVSVVVVKKEQNSCAYLPPPSSFQHAGGGVFAEPTKHRRDEDNQDDDGVITAGQWMLAGVLTLAYLNHRK